MDEHGPVIDSPIRSGDFPVRYVKWPEGKPQHTSGFRSFHR